MDGEKCVVGFISPPDWDDPSPAEYSRLTGLDTCQISLDGAGLSWQLDEIAEFEPAMVDAGQALVEQGATVLAIVGTPFGWAGLPDGERPHDRNERIATTCGVPVVSAVSGVFDWVGAIGARRLGLAVTYYDEEWIRQWTQLLSDHGYEVVHASSLADIGATDGPLSAGDTTHWAPTPSQIADNVAAVATDVDAVIVSGAGSRTLTIADRLNEIAGVPVVASDTALYRALDQTRKE